MFMYCGTSSNKSFQQFICVVVVFLLSHATILLVCVGPDRQKRNKKTCKVGGWLSEASFMPGNIQSVHAD